MSRRRSIRLGVRGLLVVAALFAAGSGVAEPPEGRPIAARPIAARPYDAERAHFHYQMFCQGCHTPNGVGADAVPRMKDFVGTFLRSSQGREFLVRVPGAATSALADDDLAAVLNWIVLEFGGASVPPGFKPYTGEEVADLRSSPLFEVERHRARVLSEIASY